MISASLPPFLDKDGFFLIAGTLCWTRCGVGMFLGTVGDVLCGPGAVRGDQTCFFLFELKRDWLHLYLLCSVVAMDIAHYRELMISAYSIMLCLWYAIFVKGFQMFFLFFLQQNKIHKFGLPDFKNPNY